MKWFTIDFLLTLFSWRQIEPSLWNRSKLISDYIFIVFSPLSVDICWRRQRNDIKYDSIVLFSRVCTIFLLSPPCAFLVWLSFVHIVVVTLEKNILQLMQRRKITQHNKVTEEHMFKEEIPLPCRVSERERDGKRQSRGLFEARLLWSWFDDHKVNYEVFFLSAICYIWSNNVWLWGSNAELFVWITNDFWKKKQFHQKNYEYESEAIHCFPKSEGWN